MTTYEIWDKVRANIAWIVREWEILWTKWDKFIFIYDNWGTLIEKTDIVKKLEPKK